MSEYDFDNWDAMQEEAAISGYATSLGKLRHIIVENSIIFEMPDKETVKLPLALTLGDLRAAMDAAQSTAEVDVLFRMLEALGEKDQSERLLSYHTATIAKLAETYFEVVGKVTSAALGK